MNALSVLILVVLVLCGCASQSEHKESFVVSTSPTMKAIPSIRPLSSGEKVRITTTYQGEKSVHNFTIDSQGNVTISAFGSIHVEGLTPEEAGRKLEADYRALPPMHRYVRFEVSRF